MKKKKLIAEIVKLQEREESLREDNYYLNTCKRRDELIKKNVKVPLYEAGIILQGILDRAGTAATDTDGLRYLLALDKLNLIQSLIVQAKEALQDEKILE